MKPPSRKHYEKSEVERLKDRIAKLEKDRPEALGIQVTIDALRIQARRLVAENTEAKEVIQNLRVVADWFDVLKRSEVMVVTPEGMKYLVGQDLEDFCKAELAKQNENKVWWGDSTIGGFKGFASNALSQIIADEIDKCALSANQLDTIKYITKGRYNYDSRSKSKKEGS